MAEFRDILTATEEQLVQIFYRVKPLKQKNFIAKIDHTAAQLGVNHEQLVCALGFNKHIRDLTDILSVIGFSSYKLLSYRRNEIFSTDTYIGVDIDNVLDIYTERIEDAELLEILRAHLPARFASIEARINDSNDPSTIMSYKMEVHAVYASSIAIREFAELRSAQGIGRFRLMTDEIQMILAEKLIPPSNMFFLDSLLPEEKAYLIESGEISELMIRNRMQNTTITAPEREMLEAHI